MLHPEYYVQKEKQERLLAMPNEPKPGYNGILTRWKNPVLTREHTPLIWRYDLDITRNPHFMQRLGVNSTFNSGAIELNGKVCLAVRVEGADRKSFFAIAESDSPVQGFRFRDYPIVLPDTCPEETDVYDMRLTKHEDGWIYGTFCSESRDVSSGNPSGAAAHCGIVRTKDLEHWERLDNLTTLRSPQQRNVVLLPEFVNGKYAFYTRPMEEFRAVGSGGGIGFGLCDDIRHAVVDGEIIASPRRFHQITEEKNGEGAVPIRTERGWIHIAHGVRMTAGGRRYVLYAFATDLREPWKTVAEPGGYLLAPYGWERVGDVGNVVFSNGAVVRENGDVYLYYASSDTRLHVASTTMDRLTDYVFNTPPDANRSADCVKQRCRLIRSNLEILRREGER